MDHIYSDQAIIQKLSCKGVGICIHSGVLYIIIYPDSLK